MSAHDISLANAALLRVVLETLLFGMSVVLSYQALRRGYNSDESRTTRRLVFSFVLALVIITTLHLTSIISHLFRWFNHSFDPALLPSRGILEQTNRLIGVSLANALIVWRLRTVWNCAISVTILPLLTLTGTFACGIGSILESTVFQHNTVGLGFFDNPAVVWTVAFLGCSVVTSLYCTVLITLKESRMIDEEATRTRVLSGLLLDSASFYTCITIVAFILYLTQLLNLASVFFSLQLPAASISFCLIIINARSKHDQEQRDLEISLATQQPHYQTKHAPILDTTMWPERLLRGPEESSSSASLHSKPSVYSKRSAPWGRRS